MIDLRFAALCVDGRGIIAKLGGNILRKFSPGEVVVDVDEDVVGGEVPLGEGFAHQVRIDVLFNLREAMLVAKGMNERDVGRVQPNLRGESSVGGVDGLGVFGNL